MCTYYPNISLILRIHVEECREIRKFINSESIINSTMNSKQKIVATGSILLSLVTAYFVGVKQNASFEELPKAAQQVILNQADSVSAHLVKSNQALSIGNYDAAISEYETCIKLFQEIKKSAPNIDKLKEEIGYQEDFINIIKNISVSINNMESRVIEIESALENKSFSSAHENAVHAGIIGLRNYLMNMHIRIEHGTSDKTLTNSWIEYHTWLKKDLLKKIGPWLKTLQKANKTHDLHVQIEMLISIKENLEKTP